LSRFKLGHPIFQKSFFRVIKPSLCIIRQEKPLQSLSNFLTFGTLFQRKKADRDGLDVGNE